jgi:hypothetical protein
LFVVVFSSKNWKSKLARLNKVVHKTNNKERGSKIRPFTEKEFLKCLGIIIAAAGFNCRGCKLWAKDNKETPTADPKTCPTIMRSPDFGQYLGGKQVQAVPEMDPLHLGEPKRKGFRSMVGILGCSLRIQQTAARFAKGF